MKKLLLSIVLLLVAAVLGGVGYLFLRKPAMAEPSRVKVEATPERLARGKYVFESLADCGGCHSERDLSKFGGPVVPSGLGKGWVIPPELGLPGQINASNITTDPETGIGRWTDGEKIRAIREGVDKDGRALFPMMPYQFYSHMSDEDVYAVVAYLNSLPPIKNYVARSNVDFPVNLLMVSAPKPVAGPVAQPDTNNPERYGEYLVYLGGCLDCHTLMEKGDYRQDMLYAGGREFRLGKFQVNSANITPDPETGIGAWTEERFIKQFRDYNRFAAGSELPTATQANFTIMPWLNWCNRPEAELKAIFAYLRTLKPIRNPVNKHPEV